MKKIALNLVVLRSADIVKAAAFYSRFGLSFTKHRHGTGAEHLAAELSEGVFELYPVSSDSASTLGTRIGFSVPSLDDALATLSDYPDAILSPAKDSPWGRRAVVCDPDGHRVELLQREPTSPTQALHPTATVAGGSVRCE
jgi:lactoylglutathione lyase